MLQLGDLMFDIDDYPEDLPLGGSSLVNIEKYPGGKKSVQNFGAFDDAIPLKGTFRYQGALDKARTADAMWRSGQPIQLIIDNLMPRWVMITSFKMTFRNEYEIPYEITLERMTSEDPNEIFYGYSQPVVSSSSDQTTSEDTASAQKTYVVQDGDTLWKIASQPDIYGDGSQYTKIVDANDIKDPSTISSGQVLVIP